MLTPEFQWGKDRPPTGQFDGYQGQQAGGPGFNAAPYFPQYGVPGGPMSPQGELVQQNQHGQSPRMYFDNLSGPAPAGRGWDQQGNNFSGGAVPGQGYQGPNNGGGYGRGQNNSGNNWQQPGVNNNNFNQSGYQS